MRVLLLQLDGKTPNLALMRIAAHHRSLRDEIELRYAPSVDAVERRLGDRFDQVYASLIFERTQPVARRLLRIYPEAIIGGSGWDLETTVESVGVFTREMDYSIYPKYPHSMGFTQRGCRLKCSFCIVPRKEGEVKVVATIADIWRGEPWPKNILLLDNDFFGQTAWRQRIDELNAGGFKVSWNQGFNVRLIGDEEAAAIASTRYYDDQFKERRLYTAWDNRKDESRLFRNLESLSKYGVKPDQIVVYMLVAYDHRTQSARPFLVDDDFYRLRRLQEFGCRPYPMPFVRNDETRGFQRWAVRRLSWNVSWDEFKAARFQPSNLGRVRMAATPLFDLMNEEAVHGTP